MHEVVSSSVYSQPRRRDDNPILDTRYWTLLKDILLPDTVKARTGGSSARLRSWIPSLVSRVPIIPIVSSFGTACTSHVASLSPALPLEASNCLSVLWPYAVGKSSPDLLLECFGASLSLATSPLANQPGIPELLALITSGYRSAFGNSTHKKKVCSIVPPNVRVSDGVWCSCILASCRNIYTNGFAVSTPTQHIPAVRSHRRFTTRGLKLFLTWRIYGILRTRPFREVSKRSFPSSCDRRRRVRCPVYLGFWIPSSVSPEGSKDHM